jgi:hypothetical protein
MVSKEHKVFKVLMVQ